MKARDDGGTANSGADTSPMQSFTITVTAVNDAPELPDSLTTQTVQYSDAIQPVSITATDIDSAGSSLTPSLGMADGSDLPAGLQLSLTPVGTTAYSATWTLWGRITAAQGSYTVRVTVSDGGSPSATDYVNATFDVDKENARVRFFGGNPVALRVQEDPATGERVSGPFSLSAYVTEVIPDLPEGSGLSGDISLADLSMVLVAVGPGGALALPDCTQETKGTGYDARNTITCSFDDVPVNTYAVQVTVNGDYYEADTGEDVVGVYDPSLGFVTGAGDFEWPDTDEPTHFSFTTQYNKSGKNVQGALMLTRVTEEGSYRLKSNALSSLSISKPENSYGWATLAGKATYQEPGWPDAIGNYTFIVYVEDNNEPNAGIDRFWVEIKDRDGSVVSVMSMDREAGDNAVEVDQLPDPYGTSVMGSNVFVPHSVGSIVTPTPTLEPTLTPVPTGTLTPVPTPSATPVPTGTIEPTWTPEPTGTPAPTGTPEPTVSPTPTAVPTGTSEPSPTATLEPGPSLTPTSSMEPSPTPTAIPTWEPSPTPTATLQPSPTPKPTKPPKNR